MKTIKVKVINHSNNELPQYATRCQPAWIFVRSLMSR